MCIRDRSNNSVCYTEKPDIGIFMREWTALYESKSGERGIFNRTAAKKMAPERRDNSYEFGCNPCSEVILRSCGLCNLSEVVLRPDDTLDIIKKKIKHAAILGTFQSTLTNFRYVRPVWKKNAEEERLLGVSLTGIFDCLEISSATPEVLEELKQVAIKTNKEYANKLGIPQSVAVTCVKPSGTVSQLTGVSGSGLHPSYSEYYIRRVRQDKKDPLNKALIDAGVPYIEDPYNKEAIVFEFPMRSPKLSVTRNQISALEHLEVWKRFAVHWSEHKPSVTIYTGEDEWLEVAAWLYKNFDILSGISILPKADESHSYEATPYEEITMSEYNRLMKSFPSQKIDWDVNEVVDNTTGSQELACTGDACEI